MPNLKIVLVGGGSYGWTPRLVSNILLNEYLDGSEVVLYDLNPEALALTHAVCLKYRELSDAKTTIEKTTDRAAALDGAHAVVVTITTGGLKAMKHDLEIPEKYGIYQTVGDTVGPSGLVRSLRNIPVFLDLGRAMETHCPAAWMLNCSNPLAALTCVVLRETSIRALGVCHGVPGSANKYANFFDLERAACSYVNTGIDHCSWFTKFEVAGRSVLECLQEKGLDDWIGLPPKEAAEDETFGKLYSFRMGLMLGRNLGAIPAIGDRHMVEFVPGFLDSPKTIKKYGIVRTSVEEREKNVVGAHSRLEKILNNDDEVKLQRGGDEVDEWITALYGGPPKEDNLSAPNIGQVSQLPEGAVVETRGVLDGAGFHPLVSPMPESIQAIVRPHTVREEIIIEAALEGSFEKALAAMTTDPLVGNGNLAKPLLEDLIAANREWLPQFE